AAGKHGEKEKKEMRAAGIIMECSPFHEGHAYLLQKTREESGADYLVVVMSGDYVQRGEPAVFDKYIRAEQILRAGADLVLELPLYAACGSAEYFARGSIDLLEKLGVITDLWFGSESGDTDRLADCARALETAESGRQDGASAPSSPYRERLRTELRAGRPFPEARAAALGDILPAEPNDLLGVEYCRALQSRRSAIRPCAVKRIDVPPATARRKALLENRSGLGPAAAAQVPLYPLCPDDFSSALLYALRMQEDALEKYADVSGDLSDRIRNLLPRFRGFSRFVDLLKTRNLTRTRVSRCLLHILLRMEQDRLDAFRRDGYALYARPLALRRDASPLLSSIRRNASVPFLSKPAKAGGLLTGDALRLWKDEIRAEELYTLILAGSIPESWSGTACAGPVPRAAGRRLIVLPGSSAF
ncbi:MAG: nucleotidyltransferase family protein, partial [Eubacteriales bacterium]|nr:nucleotidyltransferase family protein [Eubacteriales bacterium]